MQILTHTELQAITNQLYREKALCASYRSASLDTKDPELQAQFKTCAQQHQQNYTILLQHLR